MFLAPLAMGLGRIGMVAGRVGAAAGRVGSAAVRYGGRARIAGPIRMLGRVGRTGNRGITTRGPLYAHGEHGGLQMSRTNPYSWNPGGPIGNPYRMDPGISRMYAQGAANRAAFKTGVGRLGMISSGAGVIGQVSHSLGNTSRARESAYAQYGELQMLARNAKIAQKRLMDMHSKAVHGKKGTKRGRDAEWGTSTGNKRSKGSSFGSGAGYSSVQRVAQMNAYLKQKKNRR